MWQRNVNWCCEELERAATKINQSLTASAIRELSSLTQRPETTYFRGMSVICVSCFDQIAYSSA
eukprot:6196670-Pleurochrysis_carterae.AAC.2